MLKHNCFYYFKAYLISIIKTSEYLLPSMLYVFLCLSCSIATVMKMTLSKKENIEQDYKDKNVG